MGCQKNENENIVQQNPMGQCQRSGKQRPFHSNNYFSSQNRGSRVNKTSTEEVRIKKNLKQQKEENNKNKIRNKELEQKKWQN